MKLPKDGKLEGTFRIHQGRGAPGPSCGTYCDEFGNCGVNPASNKQEYSYRVCFDQNGNYTHTEYQYRSGGFLNCGC